MTVAVRSQQVKPELRELVVAASLALARMDADRLEDLALSCAALNRDLAPITDAEREERARQARDAAAEMAVFGRVLEATRANLDVMERVREKRGSRLEYGRAWKLWAFAEKNDGNH